MKKTPDPIERLIRHSVETEVSDVPLGVILKIQELFLDTLGCMLAGSTAEGIQPLLDTLNLWGGHPQATVLGFGEQTSVPFAAMINSAMGHARDFDDTHDKAVNHGCVTLVPALLALAEFLSSSQTESENIPFRKIGGKEFLASMAIGLDVANRMGCAHVAYLHTGWLPTTLWGAFGIVAAGARLLRLDFEQTADAFGLAYSQINGNRQALADGRLAKRMQPGFSAFAGIQALFMAMNGITGSRNIISGAFGISALYTNSRMDMDVLERGLGQQYETSNISLKPYPSCRCTHAVIDAALAIREDYNFEASEIVSGKIFLPPVSMGQVGRDFTIRENPVIDAQFSAQYTAALCFIKGKPRLNHFSAEAIRSAGDIMSLAALLETVEYLPESRELAPVEMELTLLDGRVLKERITSPLGSPDNPMSQEDILFKFNDCLGYCIKPYTSGQAEALSQRVGGMLESDDMDSLFDCLA